MKKVCFIGAILAVLGFTTLANATLVDNGVYNGNHFIYDTDLNITWYDASPATMTWGSANTWANDLTVTVGSSTYADWRLPTTPGTTTGITSQGEMGDLYFDELDNVAYGPLTHTSPFTNLQAAIYWTGITYPGPDFAMYYNFNSGNQSVQAKTQVFNVMAVHAGNVGAVPIPGSIFLFAPGLLGLAVLRRRWKK